MAVSVGVGPTGVGQELLGVGNVGFDHHLRVVPGHAVVFRIAGGGKAVEGRLSHLLPVYGIGHGLSDLQAAGDVVADGVTVLGGLPGVRLHRQGDAPVIHGGDGLHGIARHLGGGQGGGGEGHIHLTGLDGGQGGVLVLEDDGDLPDGRNLSVVVLVGLQNQLLLLVPLDKLVRPEPMGATP